MIDDLCEAVVSQLNSRDWEPSFAAVYDDTPNFGPEDLKCLTVTLMPADKQQELETRGHDNYQMAVEICFEQKAPPRPNAGPDPIKEMAKQLRLLQETVADWLSIRTNRQPPDYPPAVLKKITQAPIYDAEMLTTKRHYVGVMRLVYQEIRRPGP